MAFDGANAQAKRALGMLYFEVEKIELAERENSWLALATFRKPTTKGRANCKLQETSHSSA